MITNSIPRNRLLNKEHYLHGITLDMDDHVISLKSNGKVFARFTHHAPYSEIVHAADQELEMNKAVTIGGIEYV